jgi:hypothetical protein
MKNTPDNQSGNCSFLFFGLVFTFSPFLGFFIHILSIDIHFIPFYTILYLFYPFFIPFLSLFYPFFIPFLSLFYPFFIPFLSLFYPFFIPFFIQFLSNFNVVCRIKNTPNPGTVVLVKEFFVQNKKDIIRSKWCPSADSSCLVTGSENTGIYFFGILFCIYFRAFFLSFSLSEGYPVHGISSRRGRDLAYT